MHRFLTSFFFWALAVVSLLTLASVPTLFIRHEGLSGLRAVPLVLVDISEMVGTLLPIAALGGAMTMRRLDVTKSGPSWHWVGMTGSGFIAGMLVLAIVWFAAPAVRRMVVSKAYGADGPPEFNPKSLSPAELLRYPAKERPGGPNMASDELQIGQHLRLVEFELYRRQSAVILGVVYTFCGWFLGWWFSLIGSRWAKRLSELGAVTLLTLSMGLAEASARDSTALGISHSSSAVWCGLIVPMMALAVLAACSFIAGRHLRIEDISRANSHSKLREA